MPDVTKAQSDIARANDDLNRRQSLTGNGAVSGEELNHARTQLDTAKSAAGRRAGRRAVAAREQLASNQALTEGTSVEQHPSVQVAAARVREAYLATQRAGLLAPVDGYVAKRTVQLGQRAAAGTPMMSIIPLKQVWVDANFKEVQLRNIRIGQPVTLVADLYGKKVEYKGTVAGLGVGTGAAFSLLPAQNATGNWIKVVQRVPVRIALDAKQLADNPLRVGLSMDAEVDVSNKDGKTLADAPRDAAVAHTQTYGAQDDAADRDVQRVIAANTGKAAVKSAKAAKAKPVLPAGGRFRPPRPAPMRRPWRSATRCPWPATVRRAKPRPQHAQPRQTPPRFPPAPPSQGFHGFRTCFRLHRTSAADGLGTPVGTLALSAATFMNVLDTSIANVSLPAIAGDLGVSPNQGTWVITSFGVANAIAVPLTGWLSQRFGQVRLFTASVLLFVLTSWLCGLAPNMTTLIFLRVLQGLVAGPMIPLVAGAAAVELPARRSRGWPWRYGP